MSLEHVVEERIETLERVTEEFGVECPSLIYHSLNINYKLLIRITTCKITQRDAVRKLRGLDYFFHKGFYHD